MISLMIKKYGDLEQSLGESIQALKYLSKGHAKGKVVLKMS